MLTRASTQDGLSATNSQSGPNTDTATVKVAMLPMTFQNWSKLFILCGIVLPDSVTHDRHCVPIPTPRRARHRSQPHQQIAMGAPADSTYTTNDHARSSGVLHDDH
jgi:hypothetical protein